MNKTVKKVLARGGAGAGIGNVISAVIALIIGAASDTIAMTVYDYAKYTLSATVIGFVFAAASLLFESEKISLLKATLLHFACLAATFYPCALFAGWYGFHWKELTISAAVFAACYVFIWLGLYLGMKAKARKLNARLAEQRNRMA